MLSTIRTPTATDYLRLFALSAIWGTSFLCIAIALDDFSPLEIAIWRVLIAAAAIGGYCYLTKLSIPMTRRALRLFTSIGLLNTAIPFSLIGWGQQTVDSATTALLLAASPFVTLLLSHFLTADDRFTLPKLAGLIVGFGGVVVLLLHDLVSATGTLSGMLAILLAAACYAGSGVLIRRLGNMSGLVVAAGTMLATAVLLLPLLFLLMPIEPTQWQSRGGMALLFLAIGPTAIAYVFRAQVVQTNGAVFMSNVGYLIPLFALLWAWIFLDERPTLIVSVAMLMIFTGLAIGRGRFLWRS